MQCQRKLTGTVMCRYVRVLYGSGQETKVQNVVPSPWPPHLCAVFVLCSWCRRLCTTTCSCTSTLLLLIMLLTLLLILLLMRSTRSHRSGYSRQRSGRRGSRGRPGRKMTARCGWVRPAATVLTSPLCMGAYPNEFLGVKREHDHVCTASHQGQWPFMS